ncbi:hypothetical protein CFC21_056251 [Triticum aestivum]|uniref:Uncharacterized protein n=2 Tax=Triticum aestivum TaxID=4565 RepID=A0A9R1GHR9_WHEAT|nr:hypothetical protein CFC21_056251 [Triticum aestivum]
METKEGPILSVLSKRLHALRKQQNCIAQMEEFVAAGKTLSQEKEAMHSKPVLAAIIDELERLRAPLAAALVEELSTIFALLPVPRPSRTSSSFSCTISIMSFTRIFVSCSMRGVGRHSS